MANPLLIDSEFTMIPASLILPTGVAYVAEQAPALVTQLGIAGLIGWMWLSERRAAAEREKQLTEAHARIAESGVELDVLLEAVRENTRAMATLEAGQRRLISTVERLESKLPGGRSDGQPDEPAGPRSRAG